MEGNFVLYVKKKNEVYYFCYDDVSNFAISNIRQVEFDYTETGEQD